MTTRKILKKVLAFTRNERIIQFMGCTSQTTTTEQEIKMNAFELVEAAFDAAQSDYSAVTVEYIKQYADGALDTYVSEETAQKIVDAIKAYEDEEVILDDEAYDRLIKRPLSEIEL